jgi:serine protease
LSSFKGIDGTSMAAPHVAGVMALMRWVNPAITPDQVTSLLQSGRLTDELGPAGKDSTFGWGLINARKAVDEARNTLGGTPPPPPNVPVVASPSTLDFGSTLSQLTLRLAASGSTNERVVSVTPDSNAVSVSAATVDANGLGDYTVRVDRSRVPTSTASYFPKLTVQLTPTRSFTVQLAFVVVGPGGQPAAGGNVGPIYVLVYNPATDQTREARALFANGRYTWSLPNYTGSKAIILAGTDLDSNNFICDLAEVCGGFPILSTDNEMTIDITGNRNDLDFTVAPTTDSSGSSVSGASGATPPVKARRLPR